jgi:DNA polymerase elongation subunit (family B)
MKIDSINFDLDQWRGKSSGEIQEEINRLEAIKMQRTNQEQSIKLLINSIYGAYGSVYFIMYSTDIAESITLQGQDIIKNADRYINIYFNKHWHNDTQLHEALGITSNVHQIVSECTIYNDTDSAYVSFDQVLKSCDWKDDPKKFILSLYELRLKDFLDNCFDQYAKKFGTKNLQNFEMEMISESAIFIAKKKYILNPVWKDPGINIESLSKIKPKGVEMIQGSTPVFVREKMVTFMKHIFKQKKDLKYSEFVRMLKDAKSEFMVQPIERISMTKTINDYDKYIANDIPSSGDFSVRKQCPIHLRAAGYYNYLLNSNKKCKSKYEMIKSGNKVKYYHCQEEDVVFAYHTSSYPYEFAPKMNFDIQFEKTIIAPMNRVLEVLGFPPVPGNLITTKRLF